jgi:hypothetical protein
MAATASRRRHRESGVAGILFDKNVKSRCPCPNQNSRELQAVLDHFDLCRASIVVGRAGFKVFDLGQQAGALPTQIPDVAVQAVRAMVHA